jgi:hypothetical protein
MHRCVLALAVFAVACDDGRPASPGGDAAPDSASPADAAAPRDAAPPPRDLAPPDADQPDLSDRDLGPADASPGDAGHDAVVEVPDAQPRDATLDAAPPLVDFGFTCPPPEDAGAPPVDESCNYRDDDGDGRVDEGFRYEWIRGPERLPIDPIFYNEILHLRLVWSGDGYGVLWGRDPLKFLKLSDDGEIEGPIVDIAAGPSPVYGFSTDLEFAGERFLVSFSQFLRERGTYAYYQLLTREGRPFGRPAIVDRAKAAGTFTSIARIGDNFAIFNNANRRDDDHTQVSSFVIIDQHGRVVRGPFETYVRSLDGPRAFSIGIGMDFDCAGFGMAWDSISFVAGDDVFFMRWDTDGNVLVRGRNMSNHGGASSLDNAEIAWTGRYYAVGYHLLVENSTAQLILIDREGRAIQPPTVLGQHPEAFVEQVLWTGNQLAIDGLFRRDGEDVNFLRVSGDGEVVDGFETGLHGTRRYVARPFAPITAVGVQRDEPSDGELQWLNFGEIGCP